MAAAARKRVAKSPVAEIRLPPPPTRPVEAGAQHAPIASPAHQLLADLDRQLHAGAAPDPVVRKWPPSLALIFLLGASAALWAGVIVGFSALIH